MCGIAGVVAEKEEVVKRALPPMIAAQMHRGPDDSGTFYHPFADYTLGFGHRRLSILDLSLCGHQPMVHPDTGDALIFNGEIYNFRHLRKELETAGEHFRSTGDTEVLLRGLVRYGVAFLDRLEGMYAFGFFRRSDNQLLLARDPMGIKPLYFAQTSSSLLFASEVRAIMASGLVPYELDHRGIAGLLAFGTVQQPLTVFRHVRSFPVGSYHVFSSTSLTAAPAPTKHWNYPPVRKELDERSAIAAVTSTLNLAVRDHLESDVPVGVFLSSGIDSTVIAALAAQHSSRLQSFTVGFADQPDMSELAMARETAQLFHLQHTEVQVTGSDAETAALTWLQSLDQPSMDGLNVYVISKAVREHGITVALSGQGGDELFCGYPSFADVPRLCRFIRRLTWMPQSVRGTLARLATVGRSEAHRQKTADILRTEGELLDVYLQRRRTMSDEQLRALGMEANPLGLVHNFLPPQAAEEISLVPDDDIASLSRLESHFYQGNMLLRDGDANGMAHSLEIRVPMLDRRLLDVVHAIPGHLRLPNPSAKKHLLRRAFQQYLRPSLMSQPKRGFTLPIRRWMIGPLRPLCEEAIAHLKQGILLNPSGVDLVWRTFLSAPESPIWSRAFTLCVLGQYLKQVFEPRGPVSPAPRSGKPSVLR